MRFLENHSGLNSLVKGGVVALVLFGVVQLSFSWWSIVFCALALAVLYLREPAPIRRLVRYSFIVAWVCGVSGAALIAATLPQAVARWFEMGIIIVVWLAYAALFFITGTAHLERRALYGTVNAVTVTALYLVFFGLAQSSLTKFSFTVQIFPLVVFVGTAVMVWEAILFARAGGRRAAALAVATALAAVEIATVSLFLPLGFLNAAVLVSVAVLLIRDGVVAHLSGTLGARTLLRDLAVFTVLTVLVFATAWWNA